MAFSGIKSIVAVHADPFPLTLPRPPRLLLGGPQQPTEHDYSEDYDYVDASVLHDVAHSGTCMAGRVGIGIMGGFLLSFCAMMLQPWSPRGSGGLRAQTAAAAAAPGDRPQGEWEIHEILRPVCIVLFLVSSYLLKHIRFFADFIDSVRPWGSLSASRAPLLMI
jgi:hypothetical protein